MPTGALMVVGKNLLDRARLIMAHQREYFSTYTGYTSRNTFACCGPGTGVKQRNQGVLHLCAAKHFP
jgi:hypothetical protein